MNASLVALLTVLLAPQYETPIEARELTLANQYRHVAELYGRQQFDPSITALAAWKKADIETAVGRLHSNLLAGGRWTPRLTRIAVMLHTDLAMRRFEDDRGSTDGQWHLRMAERLLRFPELHSQDPFRREWYLAAATAYHSMVDSFSARELLRLARTLFPRDAAVLFASGTTEETIANIPPARRTLVTQEFLQQARSARTWELAQAREYFRRALEIVPDHERARLHLGRVLMLLGSRDAVDTLTSLEKSREAPIRHLAALFLGAFHQERRAWSNAVSAYESSLRHHPRSRAAAIALSEALEHGGRTADARQVLVSHLELQDPSPDREPWVEYWRLQAPAMDDLWLPLRTEALK
jgi:tetratricopeptide (TPR) repeat protein